MGISIPMNMDGFPSPTNLTTALIGHHRTNHLKLLVIKNEAIKFMAPHYLSSLMARSRSLAILQIYSSYIYICIIHTYIYILSSRDVLHHVDFVGLPRVNTTLDHFPGEMMCFPKTGSWIHPVQRLFKPPREARESWSARRTWAARSSVDGWTIPSLELEMEQHHCLVVQ